MDGKCIRQRLSLDGMKRIYEASVWLDLPNTVKRADFRNRLPTGYKRGHRRCPAHPLQ